MDPEHRGAKCVTGRPERGLRKVGTHDLSHGVNIEEMLT